jgi:mRNA interferase MazF
MNERVRRGEVWFADLDPVRGHEQAGRRPVLVVSSERFNASRAGLVLVVPLTRTDRGIPSHVAIDPPDGGIRERSFAMCEAIRSIAKERLADRPLGIVSRLVMETVEDRLSILLDL